MGYALDYSARSLLYRWNVWYVISRVSLVDKERNTLSQQFCAVLKKMPMESEMFGLIIGGRQGAYHFLLWIPLWYRLLICFVA